MSDAGMLLSQTRYDLLGYVRNSRAMLFTIVMPVVLLLLFNTIFGGGTTEFNGQQVAAANYFTPAIIAYSIMLSGYSSLLIQVATARERGIIKRFRGTPMPAWLYLAAMVLHTIVVIAATVTVLVLIGVIFYDLQLDASVMVGVVVYTLVGTATMCALGLALTTVTTTADSASAIGPFSTVSLAFISGVFIPVEIMPHWLVTVGKVFPLAHLAVGLQTAFTQPGHTGVTAVDVGVLAAWFVVGAVLALRFFKWEPQGR